jgi:hypothetical protein
MCAKNLAPAKSHRGNVWVVLLEHYVTIWSTTYKDFDDGVTGVTPTRVIQSLLGLILGCFLVPCLGYYSSDSSFLFTTEGGAQTI